MIFSTNGAVKTGYPYANGYPASSWHCIWQRLHGYENRFWKYRQLSQNWVSGTISNSKASTQQRTPSTEWNVFLALFVLPQICCFSHLFHSHTLLAKWANWKARPYDIQDKSCRMILLLVILAGAGRMEREWVGRRRKKEFYMSCPRNLPEYFGYHGITPCFLLAPSWKR